MSYYAGDYEVAVIGAGHAGCEAALACSRKGHKTLLFSISLECVANMPCNPNIGGTSKGHLVREIDALGGEMGKNIDKTFIQSRMLNTSKGPAVYSLRAQADRKKYQQEMKHTLEKQENLSIKQAEIVDIKVEDGKVTAVETNIGAIYGVKAVIIATGTYLKGKIFIGETNFESGPDGVFPANKLSKCLKNLGIGGDYFPEQSEIYVNEFLKNHGSSSIAEKGYGMTENSSTAGVCLVGVNKINSLGIPLPLNTYGIFERGTDKELKYGEEGEICITGPTEMLGYLDNEEEEGKVIKIHSDGKKWIHSEDVGIIDEDGFLFFKGRYKRLIPHGGFKLYPSYIEGVIMKHPNIDNCCVISIPDKVYGASPEAHVVIKKDSVSELKKLKEELIKLCQDKLPSYSQPEDFIFEEDLPLTSVGKVDYKKVEKMRIKKLEESTK